MIKNFYKLYIKISVIILTLILLLPITKLNAHNVTQSPWLFINDLPFTEDTENPIPNPSKLPWGEHVFSEDLKIGDSIKVSVDRDVIVRDLNVAKENIKTSYGLTSTDGKDESFSDDFTKVLDNTGNYFLKVALNRKDNNDEIILESAMIVVGDREGASEFKVNGENIDINSASPTFKIKDTYDLKFEITNPGDYNYVWDLGTGETKNGASIEYSFDKAKIPVYVVLRKSNKITHVFADSYVRIDSDKQTEFGIPRPPVKVPPIEVNNNLGLYIAVGLVGIIIVILTIIYFAKFRKIIDDNKRN